MKKSNFLLFIPLASLFINIGCKKEVALENLESDTITPSFGVPIAEATLNLGRYLDSAKNSFIVTNSATGILEYIYPKTLFDLRAADFFTLSLSPISASVSMPAPAVTAFNSGGAGTNVSFGQASTESLSFPNGEQLDSITVKSGNLTVDITSTFTHDGSVTIIIPSLKSPIGTIYSTTIPLDYVATIPVTGSSSLDITGYTFDLTDSATTSNTINYEVAIQLTNSGTGATGAESIDVSIDLGINEFQTIYGYFGNSTSFIDQDTIAIDFFQNLFGGTIHVADPRIELDFINSTGIPVQTIFNAVYSPTPGSSVTIGGPGLSSIPLITAPTTVGDSTTTSHIIDNSNTSPTLSALVDESPEEIVYDGSTQVNPSGPANNFLDESSKIKCNSRFVLPLYGWGNNFNLTDTSSFDAEDILGDSVSEVKSATVRLFVTNEFPVGASVQLYFADSNNVVIDSLFTTANGENIIAAAPVNTSAPISSLLYGTSTGSVKKITDVTLDKAKLINLSNNGVKKIFMLVSANTTNASSAIDVKFLPRYNIKVKVSARVNLELKPEFN